MSHCPRFSGRFFALILCEVSHIELSNNVRVSSRRTIPELIAVFNTNAPMSFDGDRDETEKMMRQQGMAKVLIRITILTRYL